jgi:hypothetical protein
MPLFGPTTEVRLSVEPSTVSAGEEIVCRVDIGEIDPKVQGGRVEFGYENTYECHGRDSDGSSRPEDTDWVSVQTAPLFAAPAVPGPRVVHFQIPLDAPPTVDYAVEWLVRAIVERRKGRNATAEQTVTVHAAPAALTHRTRTPPESSSDIPLTVELATRELRRGGTLTGTISAIPAVALDARGLRVQLVSERHEHDGIVNSDVETVVAVTGKIALRAGQPITAPFAITLDPEASPCWQAKNNSQHWYLEAVIDLPMRQDKTTRIELLVT